MPNRRKLLTATGAALLSSVAGCASVIQETADGPETQTTEADPTLDPTQTTAERTTTERNTTKNASEGNASEGNVSGENVSEPNATTGTTDSTDSLGRVSIDPPKVVIPKSLVPSNPQKYEYARIGRKDAPVTATLYGNWKCPYTREFVVKMMGDVIQNFVKPGDVALEFRALSYLGGEPFLGDDAPRAARAGLEVWNTAPKKYWQYFASVFTNQPAERYEWATADRLVRFAKHANVRKTNAVQQALLTGKHRKTVRKTTKKANQRNVATVPRIATKNEVTAPTVDFETTKRQLRRAVRR